MHSTSRHHRDRAGGARTVAAVVATVAVLSLVLSGCGHLHAGSGAGGEPPVLHLVTGSDALGRDAAPAGVDIGGSFGGWVLVGALPDRPTRAAVRRWAAGPAGAAEIGRLAGVLGVTGSPVRHAHGWVVTGAAGVLRVRDGGGHQWSFTRTDRADCPPVSVDVDRSDGAGSAGCAVAPSTGRVDPPGPSDLATRSMAAPLLAAMDLAPADVAAASVYIDSPDSTLSVSPTVDGMPTQGLATSVIVDRTGIAGAGGRLDLPTAGDVYPLRTAKQAFDALANGPRPLMEPYCGPIPGQPGSTPGTALPPVPCPSPVPVRVTGARIGLLLSYDASSSAPGPGVELAVPAWFFTVADDAAEPAVIAIDPSFLAPPAQPEPTNGPDGLPGSGSDGSPGSVTGGTPTSPYPPPASPTSPHT